MKSIEFAEITRRIINAQGFEGFLPTLCLPERRDIRALEGAPEGTGMEQALIKWAESIAKEGEEFLLAFKHASSEFKVIRRADSQLESELFSVA